MGSPQLVKDSVRLVCYTDAQLAGQTRQQKLDEAHNAALTGKSCPGK